MMTSELTGALLDFWTARAEGVPADELEIRDAQRPDDPHAPKQFCVRKMAYRNGEPCAVIRIDYSTNWAVAGPLVEKHSLNVVERVEGWRAYDAYSANGSTPLIAICRAVVRAMFGDDVDDLP